MATLFSRIEVWCLLLIVICGAWWAFQIDEAETSPEVVETVGGLPVAGDVDPSGLEDAALISVHEVSVSPATKGALLELTLLGLSGTDEPVALSEANIEISTSEGESVHRFFLPFDPDPLLSSEEKSLVTLKYWLDERVDVLWLTYRDQTVKVEIPPITS